MNYRDSGDPEINQLAKPQANEQTDQSDLFTDPPRGREVRDIDSNRLGVEGPKGVSLDDVEAEELEVSREGEVPTMFLTGEAGTGKTFWVKSKMAEDPHFALLAATTGIAAVNLNAITINSLLKYFDTDSLREKFVDGILTTILHRLASEGKKWLAIDECSMLVAEQLQIIYEALKIVNGYKTVKSPLGLLLTGDFCLDPDTEVRMATGEIKRAADVVVGDSLMGPDSTPRKVMRLFTGTTAMYRVLQTNGDSYKVTGNHLVTMKRGIDGSRLDRGYLRYPQLPNQIHVAARELSKSSRKFREMFVGYRVSINLPERPVTVDPYFMGLWLGDGDKSCTRITTADAEVMRYCVEYAAKWGLSCKPTSWKGRTTKARRVAITTARKQRTNPLLCCLRLYGVVNNKHIPEDYLCNSKKNRLALLAGLLDSDGSWGGGRFRYCSKLEGLARQVKHLAAGLGFRTRMYPENKAWVVHISGQSWEIPTKIQRKQSSVRSLGRSRDTSVLRVEYSGYGSFCGFELDGDRLFLLADGTVTHNCQLPPIKGNWAFKAPCWEEISKNITRLTKVWRQDNPLFLAALNAARRGRGPEAAALLREAGVQFCLSVDTKFDGTTIMEKNDVVDRFNINSLLSLPGEEVRSFPTEWTTLQRRPSDWQHVPAPLRIKEGALVMILANDVPEFSYVNGDTGHIEEIIVGENGEAQIVHVRLKRNDALVAIGRIIRDVTQKEDPPGAFKDENGDWRAPGGAYFDEKKKKWVVGEINYLPLRLAYATTVHKCVDARERIPVHDRGWIPITDVREGHITPFGEVKRIAKTERIPYLIRTKRGFEVVASGEHRWRTADGWKTTMELLPGQDCVELAPPLNFPGSPISITPEFAWWLGALVGDGNYTDRDEGQLHFSCLSAWDVGNRYKRFLNSQGYRCEWRKDKRGLHSTSKPFRKSLEKFGLAYTLAPDKHVPAIIWESGPTVWGQFLQGLFDTDGSVGRSFVVFCTRSEQLGREVQLLLLGMGIVSKRSSFKSGYKGRGDSYWQVHVPAFWLDKFRRDVGFSNSIRAEKLKRLKPNRGVIRFNGFDEVASVENIDAFARPMYDIEVAAPHVMTFSGLVGHNSQGLTLDTAQIDFRGKFFGSPAMAYVAISRCRTPQGLRIVGGPDVFAARVKVHPEVLPWL